MKTFLLTSVNSRKAGGLFYSVKNLCFSMKEFLDIYYVSYDDEFSKYDLATYEGLNMLKYSVVPYTYLGFSFDLIRILKSQKPDVIHQQGIWMFFSYAALVYKRYNKNSKQIITPRGMLDEWAIQNSSVKKKIVGFLFEYRNLKNADCIHALSYNEYISIRNFGLKNPVAIIPNGIFIKDFVKPSKEGRKKELLFLGRLHPKKGIDCLIEALKIINITNPYVLRDWVVTIAGWSQLGFLESLKKKVSDSNLDYLIRFPGEKYGSDKDEILLRADAFILPSYSEGLPMAILEAWSFKLPVLMTKECNIPEGFSCDAAIEISRSPEKLASELIDFFQLPESRLSTLGENGYNLVKSRFSWEVIGKNTLNLYNWLMGNEDKPSFVILD